MFPLPAAVAGRCRLIRSIVYATTRHGIRVNKIDRKEKAVATGQVTGSACSVGGLYPQRFVLSAHDWVGSILERIVFLGKYYFYHSQEHFPIDKALWSLIVIRQYGG